MALPPALLSNFTPGELEFIARQEMISIIPRISMPKLRFISAPRPNRTYGPFNPPERATVPLWMALELKKTSKCRIVPPDWLTMERLEEKLNAETSSASFSALPFHWMEISRMLLEVAADDIPRSEKVREILKSLREARLAKMREGISTLTPTSLQLPNVSQMELNEIRPFITLAFKRMGQLDPQAAGMQEEEEGMSVDGLEPEDEDEGGW
ncbi:DNA replication complex GINS protein PSF2 [Atractiella rhizophila]|nr:DNA replication complex GINS protein PSF2 [Atractiella rhizophila]